MNEMIKTNENTYYFCMSTGERKRLREKQRDILTEPKKMLTKSIGFDLNVSQNVRNRSTTKDLQRRPKDGITLYE